MNLNRFGLAMAAVLGMCTTGCKTNTPDNADASIDTGVADTGTTDVDFGPNSSPDLGPPPPNSCALNHGGCSVIDTCTDTDHGPVCNICAAGYSGPGNGACTDINECATNNGGCAQTCTNTAGSFTCSCAPGFALGSDGRACNDINECATNNGGCQQLCNNTPGSFACACHEYYSLDGNGTTCSDAPRPANYLKASNTAAGDLFGWSVGISPDANAIVIGAPGEGSSSTGVNHWPTDNTIPGAGAVYLYRLYGGLWDLSAYFKPAHNGAGYNFGNVVAISADFLTVAIAEHNDASNATGVNGDSSDTSAPGAGSVYVFHLDFRRGWQQTAYLKASNARAGQSFGSALALSADGNTIVVGASSESSSATGINGDGTDTSARGAGAVYVFRNNGTWQQEAYIKASNTDTNDAFGAALSVSSDGNTIAVGALNESSSATGINGNEADNSALSAGAAYIFRFASGAWSQEAYIKASNTSIGANFGGSVALTTDGNSLAVGAVGESSNASGIGGNQSDTSLNASGAVYYYEFASSAWSQRYYIKSPSPAAIQSFGTSLAFAYPMDGEKLLFVGAYAETSINGLGITTPPAASDTGVEGVGAVYTVAITSDGASEVSRYKPFAAQADENFGWSIATSSDGAFTVIGAYCENGNATTVNGDWTNTDAACSGAAFEYGGIF